MFNFMHEHPAGIYNRRATEEIEWLLDDVTDLLKRSQFKAQLHAIRDVMLPPLCADTWNPDGKAQRNRLSFRV